MLKPDKKRLDSYYAQALAVAQLSPDAETKVGAILIHGSTGAVLGSGYNGFVRGAPDSRIPNTRPEKYEYIIHAEVNLLYNCARHGISTDNCFLFCTLSPCINCTRALYQAGISKIYFKDTYRDFQKNINMQDIHIQAIPIFGEYHFMKVSPNKGLLSL